MTRRLVAALALSAALAGAAPAAGVAAPPANDDFANATQLDGTSGSAPGTTTDATSEPGEPAHGRYGYVGGRSVWYRWTAPISGTATIHLSGEWDFQVIAAYTGPDVTHLTRVALYDDDAHFGRIRFHAAAGTTYSLAVDNYSGKNDETGPFDLNFSVAPPPPNDDFVHAEALVGPDVVTTVDNFAATPEAGEPSSQGYGRTVWYSWTAPATGAATIDTSGSANDTYVGVYTGTAFDQLEAVATDELWTWRTGEQRRLSFHTVAGTTYRIQLDTRVPYEGGESRLALTTRPPPANDDLADAIDLGAAESVDTTARNDGATTEDDEPSNAEHNRYVNCYACKPVSTVWYRWTAPYRGSLTIATDAPFLTIPAVYTGADVAHLQPVANQPQSFYGTEQVRVRVEAGTTYLISVDSMWEGTGGDIELSLSLTGSPPNDDFADAAPIVQTDDYLGFNAYVDGTNVGATQEAGEPDHGAYGYDPSVWYSWTAPYTGDARLSVSRRTLPSPIFAVYTGDAVGALRRVATTNDAWQYGQRHFWATKGVTYRIAVDSADAEMGTFQLELHLRARPQNDMFADAQELGPDESVHATNAGATREDGEPKHAGNEGGASIWYRLTAPDDGTLTVHSDGGGVATELGIYTGAAVDALTEVASRDESKDQFGGPLQLHVDRGVTYRIAIDGNNFGGGPGEGTVDLRTEFDPDHPPLRVTPTFSRQRIGPVLDRGLAGGARCSRACTVDLTVLRNGSKVGSARVAGGARTRIRLALSNATRRRLRSAKKVPLVVKALARSGAQRASASVRVELRP